ncbi:unnamed protein product [Protopolystoma xenopodis]|uniref:Uncharacterized protein n=1 Tax=Protopolystoma xenopodis TaxID=117903 RepID=A0A448XG76_9PLAT|nr:unnamed protein product [Protopolystoma xenopodis]
MFPPASERLPRRCSRHRLHPRSSIGRTAGCRPGCPVAGWNGPTGLAIRMAKAAFWSLGHRLASSSPPSAAESMKASIGHMTPSHLALLVCLVVMLLAVCMATASPAFHDRVRRGGFYKCTLLPEQPDSGQTARPLVDQRGLCLLRVCG